MVINKYLLRKLLKIYTRRMECATLKEVTTSFKIIISTSLTFLLINLKKKSFKRQTYQASNIPNPTYPMFILLCSL